MQTGIKMRKPVLLTESMRTALCVYGLPDRQRAQLHCIQYARREMSESEFVDMYNNGSDVYKTFCEEIIFTLRVTAKVEDL